MATNIIEQSNNFSEVLNINYYGYNAVTAIFSRDSYLIYFLHIYLNTYEIN
jgi:hypothetical protein